MSNGMVRNALAQIQLNKENPKQEINEEMAILKRGRGKKIPLKAGASVHNHSK